MSADAPDTLIAEILSLSRRMRRESGRGPSAAELAGYLHLPLAEVRAALARAKDLAARKRGSAGCGAVLPGGLDEALTAEEEQTLDAAVQASLTPRERKILRKRFGLGKTTEATLDEVGRQFSVTRERIRQIEAKAPAKLSRKDPADS